MFRRSSSDEQRDLFDDILTALPQSKRAKALSSREYAFYREVFCRIVMGDVPPAADCGERDRGLASSGASHPRVAVYAL